MTMKNIVMGAATAALLVGCSGKSNDTSSTNSNNSASKTSPVAQTNEVRIVGSSTVYPFSTKVAQEFKNKTGHNVVVESTGSGGGHKLFCESVEPGSADITNSSRRQKKSEFENCKSNGVDEVVEVKIGFDGIIIANELNAPKVDITLEQLYWALAKEVPMSATDCTLKPNPYSKWSEIDSSLPDETIEVYGPPPTSGTRDAFVEIAMEGGAKKVACLADLKSSDSKAFKAVAHTLREDGIWIDAGENDNAIVQTLVNTPQAVGVFGYSFLEENLDKIKGAVVDGNEPTYENISSGEYPISRSLYFYIKRAHALANPAVQNFALEFTSDVASGPGGYLEEIGLVPLPDDQRRKYRNDVESLAPYSQ